MDGIVKSTILVIEDDESTRYLLRLFLQKLSGELEILYADSALEGKRLLGLNRIDLVVCDYHMGGGLGTEVLEHLRDIKSELPFILYTSEELQRISASLFSSFTIANLILLLNH